MLPIADFNIVVAGIATFAATVGYACTRRLTTDTSDLSPDEIHNALTDVSTTDAKTAPVAPQPHLASETPSTPTPEVVENVPPLSVLSRPTSPRKESLKRKIPHDGFDEPEKPVKAQQDLGYPHNLANIYPPNKRSRTPSSEAEVNTPSTPPDAVAEAQVIVVEEPVMNQKPESIIGEIVPASEPLREPAAVVEEHTLIPASIIASTFAAPSPAPQPVQIFPTTPKPVAFKSFATPSGGFAAFAGSASPFASVTKPQQSPFKPGRSIWNSEPSDLTSHPNDVTEEAPLENPFIPSIPSSKAGHALEEPPRDVSSSLVAVAKHSHVTGEEDEDAEMELKNVKLYVKRGEKNFGEGIQGQVKLLSHRTTLDERLLFRREPLWQVSMNVRVQPTVRCMFVPEENALKLILKEDVQSSKAVVPDNLADKKQELVIYVLKPGRGCSKQDFKDFAQTLTQSSHFNPTDALKADV